MLATVRIPRPVLVSVTFLAALVVKIVWSGKVKLVGENVTAGDTPTPESGSVWGLPGALSVTETEPDRVPVVLGVKVTLIVQLAPGFTVPPQVFVWANGPVTVVVPTVRIPRPVFVSVAFIAGLVVLIIWLGKARPLGGESVTRGSTPVPVRNSV